MTRPQTVLILAKDRPTRKQKDAPVRPYWKRQIERTQVQQFARDLARSGRHADHQSIFTELEAVHGIADVPDWLALIASQLDRLCALAQASAQKTDTDLSLLHKDADALA
jgi:hypothetical protein